MDAFETVITKFCEDAGLARPPIKDGSVDFVVDGLSVSVQYRPDRDDCVMFTLPIYDTEPEPCLMRRALELGVNGAETGGHFLGIKEDLFVLSSVVKLDGLSAEEFAERLVSLANVTRRVADNLSAAVAEDVSARAEREEEALHLDGAGGVPSAFTIRV